LQKVVEQELLTLMALLMSTQKEIMVDRVVVVPSTQIVITLEVYQLLQLREPEPDMALLVVAEALLGQHNLEVEVAVLEVSAPTVQVVLEEMVEQVSLYPVG
jgi:hypothetical protein